MSLVLAVSFDSKLKVGDLLTSLSVLISASALIYALSKDRGLRRREQANGVRSAAAEALAKLTRWVELQESLGDNVQDLAIATSELLDDADPDVGEARDHFWKGLDAVRRDVAAEQRKEDIESAYVRLYGRRPEVFTWFEAALAKLRAEAEDAFWALKLDAQTAILSFEDRFDGYQPAFLGDDLRNVVAAYEARIEREFGAIVADARGRLGAIIEAADDEVLDLSWRAA